MTSERMFIYGLFYGETCIYIGHTCRLHERRSRQTRKFPNAEFVVLCETDCHGLKIEREFTAAYVALGMPLLNAYNRENRAFASNGSLLQWQRDKRHAQFLLNNKV